MKNDSNLFYTCSLIEYIGREKKQRRSAVVNYLGKNTIKRFIIMQMYSIVILLKRLQTNLLKSHTSRRIHLTMLENADMRSRTIGQLVKYMND